MGAVILSTVAGSLYRLADLVHVLCHGRHRILQDVSIRRMVTLGMDLCSFSLGNPHEKVQNVHPSGDHFPPCRKSMVDPLYSANIVYIIFTLKL